MSRPSWIGVSNSERLVSSLCETYVAVQAGVSHHSIDSENDFEYVGLYPEVSYPALFDVHVVRLEAHWTRGVRTGITTGAKLPQTRLGRRQNKQKKCQYQIMILSLALVDTCQSCGGIPLMRWGRKDEDRVWQTKWELARRERFLNGLVRGSRP